ncbi:hypothetical protein Tco_1022475 [Tanacetum coccineum]
MLCTTAAVDPLLQEFDVVIRDKRRENLAVGSSFPNLRTPYQINREQGKSRKHYVGAPVPSSNDRGQIFCNDQFAKVTALSLTLILGALIVSPPRITQTSGQEVDIIKKTENQAKMTKLSMEWKRLCKIKAKVQK